MTIGTKSSPEQHRNSLGYVISERDLGERNSQPMIVWGRADDRNRVAIADAERGGAQRLKCECGSHLVAKKGSVKAHHFAHASDGAAACQKANLLALCHFAVSALADGHSLQLPVLNGKMGAVAIETAEVREFGDLAAVHVISAGKTSGRELAIAFEIRDAQDRPSDETFRTLGVSAILIDLAAHRNQSDEQIVTAIRSRARRRWIFNAKFPDLANSMGAMDDHWNMPAACAEPWQINSGAKRQRRGIITDEEWKTLPSEELKRRLFGSKYDRRRR